MAKSPAQKAPRINVGHVGYAFPMAYMTHMAWCLPAWCLPAWCLPACVGIAYMTHMACGLGAGACLPACLPACLVAGGYVPEE
jgi:hypothetical protein